MSDTPKTEFYKTNYVRFGRSERYVPEISDKKQQGQNLFNNQKEDVTPKEEFKKSDFVDRSAQLNASLNSLALFNMISLHKYEKRSNMDMLIDKKLKLDTEIINPFSKVEKLSF